MWRFFRSIVWCFKESAVLLRNISLSKSGEAESIAKNVLQWHHVRHCVSDFYMYFYSFKDVVGSHEKGERCMNSLN